MSTSKASIEQSLLTHSESPKTAQSKAKLSDLLDLDHSNELKKSFTNSQTPNSNYHLKADLLHHQKIAQFKISSSLALSSETQQIKSSLAMHECARFSTLKENGLSPNNRCNKRICSVCSNIKSQIITTEILKSLDQTRITLLDDADENTPREHCKKVLKINLNAGLTPTISELPTYISILSSTWSNLGRTKAIRDNCIGTFRAIEIIQSTDSLDHAHPHIHGFLIVHSNTDTNELDKHVRTYWKKALTKAFKKLKLKSDVRASCHTLEPLYRHTKDDLREWAKYSTKGGYNYANSEHRTKQLSTTANYWQTVDKAIKGLRLFSASGELKKGIALVREHIKANKPSKPTERKTTHAWSEVKQRYVPIAEYSPRLDDKKVPLIQSLPHTAQANKQLSILFPRENSLHSARLAKEIADKVREPLLKYGYIEIVSNDNYLTFSQNDDLFIHNNIRTNSGIGTDYSEPIEIKRDNITVRHKSLDSK